MSLKMAAVATMLAVCIGLYLYLYAYTGRAAVVFVQPEAAPTAPAAWQRQLLLYNSSAELASRVTAAVASGDLLRIVQQLAPSTRSLHGRLDLNFDGFAFRRVDGIRLPTIDFIRRLQRLGVGSDSRVPSVVHFFAFAIDKSRTKLGFDAYLSFLGAVWLSGVQQVVLWGSSLPTGRYWQLFLKNITAAGVAKKFVFGERPLPASVFGRPVSLPYHRVDIAKLQTAILLGGIFLDNDSLVFRSLRPLMRHRCTIGREDANHLSIGAFLVEPSSPFVALWYLSYQAYHPDQWGDFSVDLPHRLWSLYNDLCHVEQYSLMRPNWHKDEREMMFAKYSRLRKRWDWSPNYMIHLWDSKLPEAQQDEKTVAYVDSMFGEIARIVLFGNSTVWQ